MKWIATKTKKGKLIRHIHFQHVLGSVDTIIGFTICGAVSHRKLLALIKDDLTAPKCKNCLRVLRRLIEG